MQAELVEAIDGLQVLVDTLDIIKQGGACTKSELVSLEVKCRTLASTLSASRDRQKKYDQKGQKQQPGL